MTDRCWERGLKNQSRIPDIFRNTKIPQQVAEGLAGLQGFEP